MRGLLLHKQKISCLHFLIDASYLAFFEGVTFTVIYYFVLLLYVLVEKRECVQCNITSISSFIFLLFLNFRRTVVTIYIYIAIKKRMIFIFTFYFENWNFIQKFIIAKKWTKRRVGFLFFLKSICRCVATIAVNSLSSNIFKMIFLLMWS